MLYISGSGAARLPIGASGEVLTVDANGYPAWERTTQQTLFTMLLPTVVI